MNQSLRLRVITWNVAGRRKTAVQQVEFLHRRNPDIVTLQEVTPGSIKTLAVELRDTLGLEHIWWSLDGCPQPESRKRGLGVLISSRFPEAQSKGIRIQSPWQEKAQSVTLSTPSEPVDVHTVHVPPGSSNGWAKVEVLESIYSALAVPRGNPTILTGDLNTPKAELTSGDVVTWAQRLDKGGRPVLMRSKKGGDASRWDAAERSVLLGLKKRGLQDAFRAAEGYGVEERSWVSRRAGREFPRRFDHVFLSEGLRPETASYLHEGRLAGLSDHSPLEVDLIFRRLMDEGMSVDT